METGDGTPQTESSVRGPDAIPGLVRCHGTPGPVSGELDRVLDIAPDLVSDSSTGPRCGGSLTTFLRGSWRRGRVCYITLPQAKEAPDRRGLCRQLDVETT